MKRSANEDSSEDRDRGALRSFFPKRPATGRTASGDVTMDTTRSESQEQPSGCAGGGHNFLPHPTSPFFCCTNCGNIRGYPDAGVIAMWSGNLKEIPEGWVFCDGRNGTPDLRDKFIVGSGAEYPQRSTGGSAQVKLNMSYIPAHAHSRNTAGTQEAPVVGRILKAKAGESSNCALELKDAFTTAYSGNKTVYEIPEYHNKTGTAGSSDPTPIDIRPPYFALAFIMRRKQV